MTNRKLGDPFMHEGKLYWLTSEQGVTFTRTRTFDGVTYTDVFLDADGNVMLDSDVPPWIARDWIVKKQRDAFERARAAVEKLKAERAAQQ